MNFLKGITAKGLLVPYEDYKPLFVTKKSILISHRKMFRRLLKLPMNC